AAVVQDVTIQVISVGCGSNAGIGGTPGNGSGPGSGGTNPGNGNNNGNNNGGNNNPGDDNPGHNNPGFSDKDGDPIITKPVKTLEPEEEEPEEDKNCEELQKLKTDTKIKQSFTDLQNKVSNTNLKREFGYSYAEGSDPVEAQTENGDKVTPMFSVSDIAKLGEIFAKSSIPASVKYQDPSKFFFTLTVKNGGSTENFAIKIDNAMQFMNFSNQYYGMTNKRKKDMGRELADVYTKTRQEGGSMYDCLKDLFKFMNKNDIKGISVYQAIDTNLSNWKKLSYNPSENDIDETNCN